MKNLLEYKALAAFYFVVTFILVGFSIVSLVQGFVGQVGGNLLLAFAHYIAAPFLVLGSYLTFNKGYYKLRVLAMAKP